jgi:hypothetical protein
MPLLSTHFNILSRSAHKSSLEIMAIQTGMDKCKKIDCYFVKRNEKGDASIKEKEKQKKKRKKQKEKKRNLDKGKEKEEEREHLCLLARKRLCKKIKRR